MIPRASSRSHRLSWLGRSTVLALLTIQPWVANAERMCGLWNHRSAIVQNRLWFTSGDYSFDDDQDARSEPSIFAIDLNHLTDFSGPVADGEIDASDLPTTDLGTSPSNFVQPAMFNGLHHLYAFPFNAEPVVPERWWSFDAADEDSENAWSPFRMTGSPRPQDSFVDGQYTSVPATGLSYYLGGHGSEDQTNNTVSLTVVDHNDPEQVIWEARVGSTDSRPPAINQGGLEYVRYGQEGVLVAFGGYNTSRPGNDIRNWPWDLQDMSVISVYDIAGQNWYEIEAGGQAPDPRSEFCTVVAAAPDDSSFNIMMYGGLNRAENMSYSETWILSIPTFEWIKVEEDNGNPDLESTDTGRMRHTCDMFRGRYMVVSGGIVLDREEWTTTPTNDADNDDDDSEDEDASVSMQTFPWESAWVNERCNPSHPPFMVLDTTTFEWRTNFDMGALYEVPDIVSAIIGGDAQGGATEREPRNGGFPNAAIANIFGQTVPRPDSENYEAAASTNDTTEEYTPTAAIAGGVIGGFAGLSVLCLVIWIWRRRKTVHLRRKPSDWSLASGISSDSRNMTALSRATTGLPPILRSPIRETFALRGASISPERRTESPSGMDKDEEEGLEMVRRGRAEYDSNESVQEKAKEMPRTGPSNRRIVLRTESPERILTRERERKISLEYPSRRAKSVDSPPQRPPRAFMF